MSAHSTLVITREDAKKELIGMVWDIAKGKLSDEVMIRLLDVLYDDRLDNFIMVDEYTEENRPHFVQRHRQ